MPFILISLDRSSARAFLPQKMMTFSSGCILVTNSIICDIILSIFFVLSMDKMRLAYPFEFFLFVNDVDNLLDRMDSGQIQRTDAHLDRILHVTFGQTSHTRWPSCTCHHSLPIGSDVQEHFTNLWLET